MDYNKVKDGEIMEFENLLQKAIGLLADKIEPFIVYFYLCFCS